MKIFFLLLTISSISLNASVSQYDVVVYGGTSSGVMAAVQAGRMGKKVALIEPTSHIGGMTASGLSRADVNNRRVIGGLTWEFFHSIATYYNSNQKLQFQFEPHVAENIFNQMISDAGVHIIYNEQLDLNNGAIMNDNFIRMIRMVSGNVLSGKIFIDATYTGDLMAAACVSHHIGREANSFYNERHNGIYSKYSHPRDRGIDPYLISGNVSSGLLPRVDSSLMGVNGDGDMRLQAYNYRLCLTNVDENKVSIPKPPNYNEQDYEIVFRAIKSGCYKFLSINEIPNGKFDANNYGAISSDFVGMNLDYPTLSYIEREQVALAHENWIKGLLWTLQNSSRIPVSMRSHYKQWGLAKDEFIDNHNWPYQLYVREARRMISDYVITENNMSPTLEDSVGMASYPMDIHVVRYYIAPDGFVSAEGGLYEHVKTPFAISYRSIVPKDKECSNLLVPVCLSASHIAYGSLRTEIVYMILGQSAGAAACLAINLDTTVQRLPYPTLKKQLLQDGQILE